MAREDGASSDETHEPEPQPEPPEPQTAEAAPPLQATPVEEAPRAAAPTVELVATPAPPPVEHTIDDVAERMRRIKESAAAVREAMLRESDGLQSEVLADDDPIEAAVTMHAGARDIATAEPKPQPPPDVAAMLGDDFDNLDDDDDLDDDDLDDDFADPPARSSKKAKRSDDGFADDDALPGTGPLDGFGFGDDDFGDDDDDDDDDDDFDGDFGDVGAGRPIPWKPVAIGAAFILLVGGGLFWDRIFPSETLEEDPAGEEANNGEDGEAKPGDDGQVAQGSVVPTPGQGQPVVPEGQQPAAVGATPAAVGAVPPAADPNAAPVDPNAPVAPPAGLPPAAPVGASTPLPPESIVILDEARALWTKAGKKRLGLAKEKLEGILATHPNSADALLLMAQVQLELGEFETSLETATRCTTVGPQTADCWLTIGVLKQNAKDKPAAAAAYERYLALAPEGAYASDAKKQLSRLK